MSAASETVARLTDAEAAAIAGRWDYLMPDDLPSALINAVSVREDDDLPVSHRARGRESAHGIEQEMRSDVAALLADRAALVAKVERCAICGHPWRNHDPEDGRCDAPCTATMVGCWCGRDMEYMRRRNAELSLAARGAA